MSSNRIVTILVCFFLPATLFIACEKNELRLTQYELPADKSFVRFVFLSPNTPSVMIKVNGIKINGSNTPGNGGLFPSTSTNPDYAAVVPDGAVRLSLPNTGTANDSVLIYTGSLSLTANKYYSVVLSDTGADRTLFAVEDKLGALPDSGFANIRFINGLGKSGPLSLIKIDSTSATVVARDTLVRNIAFKSGTEFIKVPISPVNSFLRYRVINAAGITIGGTVTPPAANSSNKRSLTFFAGGVNNGTGATAPYLIGFIYNQ